MMRTIRLLLPLLFISFQFCRAQSAPRVIEERKADGMVSLVLVVPENRFSEDELVRLSTKYLSRYDASRLVDIRFYVDEQLAPESYGKSIDHISYDYWKKEFDQELSEKGPLRAAEFLKYGESATLRIRDANGEIGERKIRGGNSFHPTLERTTLDILHVSFVKQGFGKARRLVAHFYCKMPAKVTATEAMSLAKPFFEFVGVQAVALHMREDQWFIFDAFYPWFNPFSQATVAPTLEEVGRSIEFLCRPTQGDTCFQISVGRN